MSTTQPSQQRKPGAQRYNICCIPRLRIFSLRSTKIGSALKFFDEILSIPETGAAGFSVAMDRFNLVALLEGIEDFLRDVIERIEFDPRMFQQRVQFGIDVSQLCHALTYYQDQCEDNDKQSKRCSGKPI